MTPLVLGVVLKHPQVVLTVEFSGMLPEIPQTLKEKYSKSSNSANFEARWGFTVYVYNARWVGGQKSGKIVKVYGINCKRLGEWVAKNWLILVNLN